MKNSFAIPKNVPISIFLFFVVYLSFLAFSLDGYDTGGKRERGNVQEKSVGPGQLLIRVRGPLPRLVVTSLHLTFTREREVEFPRSSTITSILNIDSTMASKSCATCLRALHRQSRLIPQVFLHALGENILTFSIESFKTHCFPCIYSHCSTPSGSQSRTKCSSTLIHSSSRP